MPTGAPSGAPAERLGVPTPRRRVAPVPVPPSPIVGRTAALQSILGALATGHRLVTVHGPGGVGKTRLLRELGRHLERPDRGGRSPGVVYVDLSGVDARSVDELALTVLTAAGLPTAEEDPVDSVVAAIGSEPLTLLVDEAEWSLDVVVPLVAEILAATPATRLVVTSRVPLDLVGERTLPLGPLACPASGASAAAIRSAPATALLLERLRDHAPDLPVTDADLQLVARIARRVDGLPLALEILAGHAATHSLGDLVDLSEAPLDVAAGGRDRSPRHHSLRDTIAWSATRLGPDAQQALRRLGVFVGSFDTAAAAAVAGLSSARAAAALHELVRDGLLQVDRRDGGSPTRYRMLRTVRDLALDFLSSTGELVDARARHRRWYAAAWRSRPRSDELIRDVQQRHDDFLQALRSALDTRDGASLGDLAMTLSRYWLFANWKRPATAWLTRVIDAGVLDPVDEARIRLQRACHAGNVDPELADGDVTAALPVIEAAGDLLTLVTAHGIASGLASNRGKHPLALEHGHRAVRAARRTTIERTADALGMLATAQAAAGDEAGVVATTGEALDILDRAGSAVARIAVCTNLGIALADVGRPTEALAALERAAVGMPHVLGGRTPAYFDLARGWVLLRCNTAEAAVPAFARALQEVPAGAADPISVETYAGLAAALAAGGYPHGPRLAAEAAELAARTPGSLTPAQHALLEELAGGSLAPRESGSPASALPTTRSLAVRLDAQLRAALTNDTVDTVESAGTIGTAGTDPV